LIKAGNRDELMEFAEECRSLSNFLVDISINQLNLSLPSRKFFEILYNRFPFHTITKQINKLQFGK
jgi:hypothetical protein